MVNPNIFKAYDIRGVYPEEINEEAVYRIGQAFAEFLKNEGEMGNRQIIVGRDARLSSDSLVESLIGALQNRAGDVIDIGLVSTPLFYWAITKEGSAGGAMITASHNPAQYNGLKLYLSQARPIDITSGLLQIKNLAAKDKADIPSAPGRVIKKSLLPEYLDFIKTKTDIKKIKPLKICLDCGNGTMGPEISELLKDLPGQAQVLFAEPDGRFPNHEANPMKEENLLALKEAVLNYQSDLGAAFDGDGDRVSFLDEKGEIIRGDFITTLIAQQLLKNNRGEKIFYEIRSSRLVPEAIIAHGGVPVLGRAGHSIIKRQMRQENIFFGGELSGHYFFKELGFVDNALLAMLKVWEVLSAESKPLSEIIKPFKKYFHSGEVNFEVKKADRLLVKVESYFSDGQIKKIDGLTVEYPDWWFNLRQSNTEPLVRLNLEANSPELMEKKLAEVKSLIEQHA